jgi:ABC-type sugar transport system ATPase subunit
MLLQLEGIQKRFGGVTALRQGTLNVQAGEVHLLMGENGAGKSTLMKIVAGMQTADEGRLLWRGQPVTFRSPRDAAEAGISMVHQESLLAPHLTVAENIFLGREGATSGFVPRKRLMQETRMLIEQYGFPLRAEAKVGELSPAGKQLVEICRAIRHGSSLLIFDEPTSSLSESETKEVFRIVAELKSRGVGVIYITHRLEELRTIGDHVTVLRDGQTVHTSALSDLTMDQLIKHMVGREVSAVYQREGIERGKVRLKVERLTRAPLLKSVSLEVHAGEILGIGGLIGAGRTELCRAIFGIDAIDSGTVEVDGVVRKIRSPREAVAAGLAYITEDRQKTGLALGLPIGKNITLASLDRVSQYGMLNQKAERAVEAKFMDRLRVKAASARQLVGRLSGGNQQKIAIAKWLAREASIFLFDEPTRGIDVGAKAEVFALMEALAKQGAAILMVSSELPELIQVADRILVMRQGQLTGELAGGCSQEAIMHLAAFKESVN